MNSDSASEYVTIIGNSYIYPVSDLLKTLIYFPKKSVNQVQTSIKKNGYSVSVITLIVLYIESLSVRIKYERREYSKKNSFSYLKSFINEPNLVTEINEIFVLRDCIVHNHLWHAKFKVNEDQSKMLLLDAELNSHFGDKKFRNVINWEKRVTKELNLNLFTTRINFIDVQIVAGVLKKFIEYIGKNEFYHLVSFYKLIDGSQKNFQSLLQEVIDA